MGRGGGYRGGPSFRSGRHPSSSNHEHSNEEGLSSCENPFSHLPLLDRCDRIADSYYECKLRRGVSDWLCQKYLALIRCEKCPDHVGEKWEPSAWAQRHRCKNLKDDYDDCRIKKGDSHKSCQKHLQMMPREKCRDSLFIERPDHLQRRLKIKCRELKKAIYRNRDDPRNLEYFENQMAEFKCPGK